MGSYLDTFAFHSPKAIRRDNEVYQYIAQSPLYPKGKSLDVLQRNGFAGDCHDIAPTKLIPALLTDSRAETLFKGGRTADLRHFLINPHGIDRYWAAYKIVLRKHYNIIDIALWCDYVDMLRRLGKDITARSMFVPKTYKKPTTRHSGSCRLSKIKKPKHAEDSKR